MQDLDKIVSKFEIDVNDHFHSIKNKLLFDFGSTLTFLIVQLHVFLLFLMFSVI